MNNQKDMSSENQEINRKRKAATAATNNNSLEFQIPRIFSSSDHLVEGEDRDFLALSLSFYPSATRPRTHSPPPQQLPLFPTVPVPAAPPLPSMQPQSIIPPLPPMPPAGYPFHMPLLSTHQQPTPPPPIPLPDASSHDPTPPAAVLRRQESSSAGPSRGSRPRRNRSQAAPDGESETVPAPYPWATDRRATVHSLDHLISKQIFKISGEVQCKRCDKQYEMEYDLREKFFQVGSFIAENKNGMHDRAPGVWMNPVLPACKFCEQENCVKPVIPDDKKTINWLFLLLGQMLGCCTLEQLKYFCQHTNNHRTGAKDRVLYLTYLCLCKQLDPNGPFDR